MKPSFDIPLLYQLFMVASDILIAELIDSSTSLPLGRTATC